MCAEGKGTGKGAKDKSKTDPLRDFAAPSPIFVGLCVVGLAAYSLMSGRGNVEEISFQHFKTELLAKNLVTKLEVTNKTTVKVFVRPSPL